MRRNARSGPSDLVSRRAFLGSAALTGAALAAPLAGQNTTAVPPPLARPDAALDFHAAVGPAYKAARLRYLRDRWVGAARGVPGLDILTPDDRQMVAGMTSFRLQGRTSSEDNQRIVDDLRTRYGLFTVRRTGLERGDCVRVTPALYNGPADVDRLAAALKQLSLERR